MGKIPSEFFENDIKAAESDLEQRFTLAGQEYPCIASEDKSGESLGMIGFTASGDVLIIVRQSLFYENAPVKGDVLTYNSEKYKITERMNSPEGNAFVLDCARSNRTET